MSAHLAGGDSPEDGGAAELTAADVVAEEQAAGGVARRVQPADGTAFVVDDLRTRIDLGTAEGGRDAALEREGVVGGACSEAAVRPACRAD